MKILVVTPMFLPFIGGAEVLTHDIYSRIGTRHQVVILTPETTVQEMPEGFDTSHYKIWRYKDWFNLGSLGGRMLLHGIVPPFSVGATIASIRAIKKFKPDVVNVTYAIYTGLAAIWSWQIANIPTVLSLLGRDAAPGPLTPKLWPWYADWVARHVSFTTFISSYCQKFHKNMGRQSCVIPCGVNVNKYQRLARDEALWQQLNLQPDHRVIFSLQRLDPIKRVDIALKALRYLMDHGDTKCVLVIGGMGRELKSLQKMADTLGISNNVRFTGFIPEPDLPRYFSLAEIFVMTSDYETFGIVLAQAMGSGLPTVSINATAIPEVVQDGVTGLLSPPGDAIALACNLQRLLAEPDLCQQMAQKARLYAEANFDIEQIAIKYETVLLSLVTTKIGKLSSV